jgi:hypothetical protein
MLGHSVLYKTRLVVAVEAAVRVGTEVSMPMVAMVKNISTKEVRERRRVANPTVAFTEATAA